MEFHSYRTFDFKSYQCSFEIAAGLGCACMGHLQQKREGFGFLSHLAAGLIVGRTSSQCWKPGLKPPLACKHLLVGRGWDGNTAKCTVSSAKWNSVMPVIMVTRR